MYLVKSVVKNAGVEHAGCVGYDTKNDEFCYLHDISSPCLCVFITKETAEKIAETVRECIASCADSNQTESFDVSVECLPPDFPNMNNIQSFIINAAYYYYLSQCC